jgi:hypothetical protein
VWVCSCVWVGACVRACVFVCVSVYGGIMCMRMCVCVCLMVILGLLRGEQGIHCSNYANFHNITDILMALDSEHILHFYLFFIKSIIFYQKLSLIQN